MTDSSTLPARTAVVTGAIQSLDRQPGACPLGAPELAYPLSPAPSIPA